MCHTSFSWSTGKRTDGVIHNPHYYEWLFANNGGAREIRIDPCGEDIPDAFTLITYMRSRQYPHIEFYMKIHRTLSHMRAMLPGLGADRVPGNRELRIQYLTGDIDEDRWHALLEWREKRRLKMNAMFLITQMIVHVLSDMVRVAIHDPRHDSAVVEFEAFRRYANEQYRSACRTHGGSIPSSLRLLYYFFD